MKGDAWRQIILLILLLMAFNFLYITLSPPVQNQSANISYSRFKSELSLDNIRNVTIQGNDLRGYFRNETEVAVDTPERTSSKYEQFMTLLPPFDDPELLKELEAHGVEIAFEKEEERSSWVTVLVYLLPWLIILGVWFVVLRGIRGKGGPGGGIMGGFSKSGARMYTRETSHVTFEDVAGLDEAKQELMEIVDFLRDPKKYTRIGGKVPRGVLLVGPPGTGKTLMARAVAGEAGVAFFSISASQFIEMFVGVGASRVRDLFTNARKSAPSIIFIDELDAVGRSRGTGLGGGNDEREQTLNQLLAELDGFDPHEEVVVMSATNRPDVLDTALLRPGRFDRQVVLDRPDWRARLGILKVHVRKVPLADDVDLEVIARSTPGMCGAELENLVNESALIAARNDLDKVSMRHFEDAKDKVMMGAERKLVLTDEEKRITAYHEAGHTLVAKALPGSDPIHKVTIIPHGQALGVTQQLPDNDRYHYSRQALMIRIAVAMGGRAAEMEIFGDLSTGAQNDLKQVTDLAEKMVCQWGMSEKVGPVTFSRGEEHPFLGKKLASEKTFSERMAWVIDQEIEKIVTEGAERASHIIHEERVSLDRLAKALLEEESLDGKRVAEIIASSNNRSD